MKGSTMRAGHQRVTARLAGLFSLGVLVLLAATGCTTLSPEKLNAYRAATAQARAAGEEILLGYPLLRDEVVRAAAERAATGGAPATDPRFDWNGGDDASNDAVAVRVRAWEVLVRYNDLLAGLVSGRPAGELGAEIDGLTGAMSQIESLAGSLADAAPYVSIVKGLLVEAKRQADRAAAVRSFVEAAPEILSFVTLLKSDTLDFYALRKNLRDLEYAALTDRLTDARGELRDMLGAAGVVTKSSGEWVSGPAGLEGVVVKANAALESIFEFKGRGIGQIAGTGGGAAAPGASAAGTALAETMKQVADRMRALDARTLAAKGVLESYDDLLDALRNSIVDLRDDAEQARAVPLDARELERCILAVRIAAKQYQEAR